MTALRASCTSRFRSRRTFGLPVYVEWKTVWICFANRFVAFSR